MQPGPTTLRIAAALLVLLASGANRQLAAGEAGGVRFDAPSSWKSDPKPMRAANYAIPPESGDSRGGELAVHYFGPGQGGGVEANVRRWLGQFVRADGSPLSAADAEREQREVGGMEVTILDVSGTYLFKPFPMAPQATPLPGYRMLAAIVQGPDAPVFFKLTAPQRTAAAAAEHFRSIIDSVRR